MRMLVATEQRAAQRAYQSSSMGNSVHALQAKVQTHAPSGMQKAADALTLSVLSVVQADTRVKEWAEAAAAAVAAATDDERIAAAHKLLTLSLRMEASAEAV